MKAITAGQPFTPKVYPRQIAFNVIPQVDVFTDNGYTKEELKMLQRRPQDHGPAGTARFPAPACACRFIARTRFPSPRNSTSPVDVDAARAAFAGKPGIQVVDDPANKIFPVPLDTTGKDDCLVGRIRKNLVLDNALDLWVVGDQVRKGAALNAVQIAEIL